jgi:6-phosphogluconate dehydrogenase
MSSTDESVQILTIGLGRMGGGMARRLRAKGWRVLGYDLDLAARSRARDEGLEVVDNLEALLAAMPYHRKILLSVPHGPASKSLIKDLEGRLREGDLLIDTANSPWREAQAHAADYAKKSLLFVDAGVSGGLRGAEIGYCVMAGGAPEAFHRARPVLEAVAMADALLHCGPPGAGHFTKMVHNGIEYGMMQSLAEGLELLKASPEFHIDLDQAATLWTRGSVIRSWLLDLAAEALREDPDLAKFEGRVGELGTGQWAAQAAADLKVETPALGAALAAREKSRQRPGFGGKVLSALRAKFGGHQEAH